MNKVLLDTDNPGWNFDNSFKLLPDILMTTIKPIPVKDPKIFIFNERLEKYLGLNFSKINLREKDLLLSGNKIPMNTQTIAQAYAGHQFGFFTNLGDGRAILIGEHLNPKNKRFDIQLKGSGRTPYSRNGDGRAALGPMLREYIISESMHYLGIPTSRSLAVVTTGESVIREKPLNGAILTRVASSHIRIGTFQYLASKGDLKTLKKLINYTVNRHYPKIEKTKNLSIELLKKFLEKQIKVIVDWMRVGFIHGVMNTDNMFLSGETIDYGPCAFMDLYDPKTVFSSIDYQGRYAFGNQPIIAHWNLSRFAETLIPFFDNDEKKSIKIGTEIINSFTEKYENEWLGMMRKKIGLIEKKEDDKKLINELLDIMLNNKMDYTNTFCDLINEDIINEKYYKNINFKNWHLKWKKRILENNKNLNNIKDLMKKNNPFIIPRNHKVEEALNFAISDQNNMKFKEYCEILSDPYNYNLKKNEYRFPSDILDKNYQTFCGT